MHHLLILLLFVFTNPFANGPDLGLDSLEKAGDFEFVHESGALQKLSDYDGNVIYVAFWASWCKPCLVNFQKYEEFRLELKRMGVVLLNVSLDKNKKDWVKALMSYGFMNGENVHVSDIRKVMDLYELTFIPEYVILNKQRQVVIVDQNEERDVWANFEDWLKE